MEKCKGCVHEAACQRWIAHGKLLYDDFDYSVEGCPDYAPKCKACFYRDKATVNKKGFLICPASGMEITEEDYCSYGERRTE